MSLRYKQLLDSGLRPDEALEMTTTLDCSNLPSMTRQSEMAGCDVNNIIKAFDARTVADLMALPAEYADVSEVGSFHEVVEKVAMATEYFMSLPAKVRAVFANDVSVFMDAVGDPAREAELKELGVRKEEPAPGEAPAPAQ